MEELCGRSQGTAPPPRTGSVRSHCPLAGSLISLRARSQEARLLWEPQSNVFLALRAQWDPRACRAARGPRSIRRPTPGSLSNFWRALPSSQLAFLHRGRFYRLPAAALAAPSRPAHFRAFVSPRGSCTFPWAAPHRSPALWSTSPPPTACPLWAPLHFDLSQSEPCPFRPVNRASCHAASTDTLLPAAHAQHRGQEPPCSDRSSLGSCPQRDVRGPCLPPSHPWLDATTQGFPPGLLFLFPVTAGARWFMALMRCPRNSTPVMSVSRPSLRCPRTLPLSDFLCLFIPLREGRVVGSHHGHRAVLRDDWGNPLAPVLICPRGRTRVLLGAPSPSPPCGHVFACGAPGASAF